MSTRDDAELQRAKTAERVTRGAAEAALRDLADALAMPDLHEFVERALDGITRTDGAHDAVDCVDRPILGVKSGG